MQHTTNTHIIFADSAEDAKAQFIALGVKPTKIQTHSSISASAPKKKILTSKAHSTSSVKSPSLLNTWRRSTPILNALTCSTTSKKQTTPKQ